MKILIIIHRTGIPGSNEWYAYDVMYRLEGFWDKIRKPRLPEQNDWEYTVDCDYVKRFVQVGWKYLFSGDTAHPPAILAEMGIKDMLDITGLVKYLRKRFPNAAMIVKT